MSGSNSSARGSGAALPEPLSFSVHSLPSPELGDAARRTASGRLKMLLVLAVCAAPVIASYFTYFVIRPEGRSNYSALILPQRPLPADLPLSDLQGRSVAPRSLQGQWLLVVVAGGACDAACEKKLWLQRQLRETLGREKERVDKLWLVSDDAAPRADTLAAISQGTPTQVLRVPPAALAAWLEPAAGQGLADPIYIVDPMGNWMMRSPADPEPARLKRDVEKLLRASASWDLPGR
jgi:hypothetical protein